MSLLQATLISAKIYCQVDLWSNNMFHHEIDICVKITVVTADVYPALCIVAWGVYRAVGSQLCDIGTWFLYAHVLDPCTVGRAGVSIDPLSFQDPHIIANGKMCKTGGNGLLHRYWSRCWYTYFSICARGHSRQFSSLFKTGRSLSSKNTCCTGITHMCTWCRQVHHNTQIYHNIQMYITTEKRPDLSFSILKINSRTPLYQPMQKILIILLAAVNYLLNCCFWTKTCKTDSIC